MEINQIDKLATALAKAQGVMLGAKKDAKNPYFKQNYSDLASVWASIREPLANNGLSVAQPLGTVKGQTCVITYLMHTSGQHMKSVLVVKPPKPDMQSLGAAISYARRYALSAMVGVYQVDLDAEETQGTTGTERTQTIQTDKEKKELLNGVTPISHDKFVTSEQATAYRKECSRLKIDTKKMKMELKKHGITMPDKIPADQFDARLKDLKFLANEGKKEVAA